MKNLRKKLALLLAFVMVLSLVPSMGVFGSSGVSFRVTRNTYDNGWLGGVNYRAYLLDANDQTANFEIGVDPAWFSDLDFTLEGWRPYTEREGAPAAESHGGFPILNAYGVPTGRYNHFLTAPPAAGTTWVLLGGQWTQVPLFQFELRLAGHRDIRASGAADPVWQYSTFTTQTVTVTSGASIWTRTPPAASTPADAPAGAFNAPRGVDVPLTGLGIPIDPVRITGQVQVRHHNTTLALYLRTVVNGAPVRVRIMDPQPLTREWTGLAAPADYTGLVVSRYGGDSVRNLNRFNPVITYVPRIRIAEYQPGTVLAGDNLQVRLEAPAGFIWEVPSGYVTIAPGGSFINGFSVSEGVAVATGVAGSPGWVEDRGPNTSVLSVVVPIGTGGLGRGGDTAARGHFDVGGLRLVPRNPGFIHPHETNFNVIVGVSNVASNIVNSTVRENVTNNPFAARATIRGSREIRVATFWQQGIVLSASGAPTQVTAGRLDQEVVSFTIAEVAPQSFNPAATLPISVSIDHVGVRIVGFEYRVFAAGAEEEYRGDFEELNVMGDGEMVMHIVDTGGGAAYVREIEIKLHLDIEPGFGVNNWSRNIVADVNVLGINALAANNRTVLVAVVRDPITLTAGSPVELDIHGDPFGVILPNVLPTVTIREVYAGAIREGHLYVYLVPTVGVHPGIVFNDPFGNLGLRVPPTPVVTGDPSLSVRFAEVMQPRTGTNETNFIKIRYIVDNVSQNNPATITFAGGSIEGVATTIPGLNVSFAVGGTSIIQGWDSDIAETVPYRVQVATFGEQIVIGTPPPTPPPGETPPPTPVPPTGPAAPAQVNIPAGMASTVGMPSGYNVGKLPAIILPGLIPGVTVTPSLGGERVTISGHRVNGNPITIVLNAFDSFAVVTTVGNAVEQDIANSSFTPRTQLSSGPAGTVWPTMEGGQLMLPLRFIARMFGYSNIGFDGTNFVLSE